MLFLSLLDIGMIILWVFRLVALVLILHFLACSFYLIQRLHRFPSLKLVLRAMLAGFKGFPGIAAHRIRIAPARMKEVLRHRGKKHVVHPAYPNTGKSSAKKSRKK